MKCSKCNEDISGEYCKVENEIFHKNCFNCEKCGEIIASEFQKLDGNYYHSKCYKEKAGLFCAQCENLLDKTWIVANNKKYHEKCYRENIQLMCLICQKPIEGEYIVDYWGNKAHKKHGIFTKTSLCECCGRIISDKTSNGGFKTNDGRLICGICRTDFVTETFQISMLKREVEALLGSVGIIIPSIEDIILTDKSSIKKLSALGDSLGFANTKKTTQNDEIINIEHTIYILHSLQRIQFLGVLAHEMIHTWLNQNLIELPKEETEGFCNLGSYLVYKNRQDDISGYLMKQLEENKDAIYGDGYRKMKKELETIDWEKLIMKIRNESRV